MSSAEKKHDYHLVDPSPWPIVVSFSALIVGLGGVYYFSTKNLWMLFIGLAVLFYAVFMWFRDVVIEAQHKGDHTPVVQISHRYGMTLFIASEVMFFIAWFWAYFDSSLFPDQIIGGIWPPKGIQTLDPWHIPLINTLILLLSGTTVTWAHHALLENDRKGLVQGLLLTVILGSIFTLFQVYEYVVAPLEALEREKPSLRSVMATSSSSMWKSRARFVSVSRTVLDTKARCVMSCSALYCATTALSTSLPIEGRTRSS